MKKYFLAIQALLMCCVIFSLTSCNKDNPVSDKSLTINKDKIAATSAVFEIIPSDKGMTYYSNCVKAADFTDEAALVKDWIASAGDQAAQQLNIGSRKQNLENLEPATAYFMYAFYIDAAELASAEPKFEAFTKVNFITDKTQDVKEENGFNIKITDITATTASIEVEPKGGEPLYWSYYVTEKQFQDYNLGDPDFFLGFIKETLDYNAGWMGITVEELVQKVRKEKYSINMIDGLAPDTKYYAFATEIDDEGFVVNDNYSYETFQTLKPEMTDFTMDLRIGGTTETTITVEYRPSDENQLWFTHYMTKAEFDKFGSDKAVLDAALELFSPYFSMGIGLYAGSGKITFPQLSPSTDYVIFAFGYNSEQASYNSDLFTIEATTAEAEEVDDDHGVTFEFDIDIQSYDNVQITTTPSDLTVTYLTDVIDLATYESFGGTPEGLKSYWQAQLVEFKDMGMTESDVIMFLGLKGQDTFKYETLREKSDYIVYGIHVDEIGRILSKISVASFSTPGKAEGPALKSFGKYRTLSAEEMSTERIQFIK